MNLAGLVERDGAAAGQVGAVFARLRLGIGPVIELDAVFLDGGRAGMRGYCVRTSNPLGLRNIQQVQVSRGWGRTGFVQVGRRSPSGS